MCNLKTIFNSVIDTLQYYAINRLQEFSVFMYFKLADFIFDLISPSEKTKVTLNCTERVSACRLQCCLRPSTPGEEWGADLWSAPTEASLFISVTRLGAGTLVSQCHDMMSPKTRGEMQSACLVTLCFLFIVGLRVTVPRLLPTGACGHSEWPTFHLTAALLLCYYCTERVWEDLQLYSKED